MPETEFIINKLFDTLNYFEREILFEKIINDTMLPVKLRDPDTTMVARGFWIFMTRSNSVHNWVPLDEIISTLTINNHIDSKALTTDEASITKYVISKYITTLSSLTN